MTWFDSLKNQPFEKLLSLFQSEPDLMVLHSALVRQEVGRYSFLCICPFAKFEAKNGSYTWNGQPIEESCPWTFLQQKLNHYKLPKHPHLPPFQGGAVGYIGYEFAHTLEHFPVVPDKMGLPTCIFHFYDQVMAYDHETQILFLMASGLSLEENQPNEERAGNALKELKQRILNAPHAERIKGGKKAQAVQSNFNQETYMKAVADIQTCILNGDIFQANLTQQFKATLSESIDHIDWYRQLCQMNPAPFSALLRVDKQAWILSASPERFLSLRDNELKVEPIKGTRKRGLTVEEDQALQTDLITSAKDRSENIMIVDLMRNDLSKVCLPGSVKVNQLCGLHSFETVHHLISTITGKLNPNFQPMDVLKATFPPGSITGAPKIKAMELISQMEKTARGPYCGCLGYLSFTGDMDMAVTIRTYVVNNHQVYFGAGGGIVMDSEPFAEYEESHTKAKRLMDVLE